MKYRMVMPHVISERFEFYLCYIRANPLGLFCERT
jgi:hypothetical protein